MTTPTLSIIILTWNTADITCSCLSSIVKHLKNIVYEIIVVDNNSTDNSVLKIKSLIHSLKIENCKLKINPQNLGFARGNNAALKHAKGKYLLFLNSDMEILDSSIADMLKFFIKNKDIGAIGPAF